MASKKFTTTEVYLQSYKNVSLKLETEKDWLKSSNDKESQQRLVDMLEATKEIMNLYPQLFDFN